ncbi:hypothetical protein CH352_04505 [Leptospira hartskeerlii]|uniref:Lipoprotein n=1 Tax=Leptospira hartskeerlii TaxID=2023177 RepID=A0A2M9XG18_9LEPT|nr:hypothetical protein [Leptospira hartskeerlii]PJZ26655.1 hypothetical protein CH357_03950 [Leptospira hartskeerlii]PJZ34863.1 hypothetical protein CH352_04505 [Leptospira hartskeerlii]
MNSFSKYSITFFVSVLSILASCSGVEKKNPEVQLPSSGEQRSEMPVLVQFEDDLEYDVKTLMATFATGVEGKDRRLDREYAKFPILVGTGARSKELELEGTVTRRVSWSKSERKEVLISIEGNKLTHNCGLGITDKTGPFSDSGKKPFRSVRLFFQSTGVRDTPRTGFAWVIGLGTYLLYPLIYTGFVVEKLDCGLVIEG